MFFLSFYFILIYSSEVAISFQDISVFFFFLFFLELYLSLDRDNLHNEVEKLRDEQRYMENDLSHIQIRWHALREEKVTAANILRDVKKSEEELERLVEEKHQVELEEKVVFIFLIVNSPWLYIFYFHLILKSCDRFVEHLFLSVSKDFRTSETTKCGFQNFHDWFYVLTFHFN